MFNQVTSELARQIDRVVLYSMNRRIPDSLQTSYREASSLEAVLTATQVDRRRTAVYNLTAPGEHPIWLNTPHGSVRCHVRVRPAVDPQAPLCIYHHGLNEYPYTNSFNRIFPAGAPRPTHAVCIQALYHDNMTDPLLKGFATVQGIYLLFATSLRMIALMQEAFTRQGAPYTVMAGVSWGGITSMLYEAFFQNTRAVIPMLASPNLAQAMMDAAALFNRPITVPQHAIMNSLDFTPHFANCRASKIYPLLGENDLFFRFDHHAPLFGQQTLSTTPDGHISAMWRTNILRQHVVNVLSVLSNGKEI